MNNVLMQATSSAFEKVFKELRLISRQFAEGIAVSWSKKGTLVEADIKQMRPGLARALMRLEGHVFSLGIILDENIISGTSYSLSWLELMPDGRIEDDSNIRYPWRGSFYEYSKAEWMNIPRSRREAVVVGPYVDFDKYILTLAVPIIVSEQFIGVAAADLRLDDFERSVAYPLSKCEQPCLVVNSEGRVVVSNTTANPVGSINETYKNMGTPMSPSGWRIITLGDTA